MTCDLQETIKAMSFITDAPRILNSWTTCSCLWHSKSLSGYLINEKICYVNIEIGPVEIAHLTICFFRPWALGIVRCRTPDLGTAQSTGWWSHEIFAAGPPWNVQDVWCTLMDIHGCCCFPGAFRKLVSAECFRNLHDFRSIGHGSTRLKPSRF